MDIPETIELTVKHELNVIQCEKCKMIFCILPVTRTRDDYGETGFEICWNKGLAATYYCPFCGVKHE